MAQPMGLPSPGLDGRLRPAAPRAAFGEDRRGGPGRCRGARRQRVGGVATGGAGQAGHGDMEGLGFLGWFLRPHMGWFDGL